MSRPGRAALLAVTGAYVLAVGWSAVVLPAQVPSHFDATGRVDATTARGAMLLFWVGLGVVVLAGVPWLTRLVSRGDGTWVNMPAASKAYWFAPERREEFRRRFGDDIEGFTAMTGCLPLALVATTTWVATSGRDEAPGWSLPTLVGLYLAATAWWTVRLLRRYRPPADA